MIEPCSNSVQTKDCNSTKGSSKKKKHSKRGCKQSESTRLSVQQDLTQKEENEREKRQFNQESITTDKSQEKSDSQDKAEDPLIQNRLLKGDECESSILRDEEDHNNTKKKEIIQQEIENETPQQTSTCFKLETGQASVVSEKLFSQNVYESSENVQPSGIFLTPQKIKKDHFSVPSSISDQNNNHMNSTKPLFPSFSVSSDSTASSQSVSQKWRHPAACPQKETQEVVREYRAEDRLQMLTKVLPPHIHSTFDSYLDLGCGNCEISAKIATHFFVKSLIACDVYPVENSQRPLDLPDHVQFEYIANENNKLTGVKDDSLDLITCFMVLHHIEQIDSNLLELKRITKEGGYLYIREHDVPANDIQLDKYLRQKHGDFHDGGVLFMKFFSKIQLKKMLAKYGFRHVADSMYNDSRPNRQKVYHSLFVKDSSFSESNSSEESTEESDRSSSIAVSRFSEQEGDEQESAKYSNEETKKSENQFHLFARTLFGNNSREGSPGQEKIPSIHSTKSYSNSQKYAHSKQLEPTQLVWRNSCQSAIQHGSKEDGSFKYKQHNQQIWRDQRSANNNYQNQKGFNHHNNHNKNNQWNTKNAPYFKQSIIYDDLHKNMKFKPSKIRDEFDFQDDDEGIFSNRRQKESVKIPLHKEHLFSKQEKTNVIKPVQLLDILS